MSDSVKHECGIAMLRLLKPLEYYREKYGTAMYGVNKMYLLMEKQHNRGQDGAGIANIKFDVEPGSSYISRERSVTSSALRDIFDNINQEFALIQEQDPALLHDTVWLKKNARFTGELFLGHLRYGTYGKNAIENCHPFVRHSNWLTKTLLLAGNFNLTNIDELFQLLIDLGQNPPEKADTVTLLEKIGHFLDEENERQFQIFKEQGKTNKEISALIAANMDIQRILQRASKEWDGGHVMGGMIGHGDAFVYRDPSGIRPAYFYQDDEVVVACSERPVIMTAFNVPLAKIQEIEPGHALVIKKNGFVQQLMCKEPREKKACTFERIYFSRGTDADIYKERQVLGRKVTPAILKAVNNDLKNTIFSFIPNTAEVAFYGMMKALEDHVAKENVEKIIALGSNASAEQITEILSLRPRAEKLAVKDAKLRTFITDDSHRNDLVSHVYDVTYGIVRPGLDNIVVIDDSIVRGTTLKQSILKILDRLGPKKVVIVSSAPQIRYPDCYGIDMAKLNDFVAFKAAIELLKQHGLKHIIEEVYRKCKMQEYMPKENVVNFVKEIYEPFSDEQVSAKIAEMIRPVEMKAELEVIFQTVADLHTSCCDHKGDWYFSGNYPTPGGNKVVNKAFINYMEGRDERAY